MLDVCSAKVDVLRLKKRLESETNNPTVLEDIAVSDRALVDPEFVSEEVAVDVEVAESPWLVDIDEVPKD